MSINYCCPTLIYRGHRREQSEADRLSIHDHERLLERMFLPLPPEFAGSNMAHIG